MICIMLLFGERRVMALRYKEIQAINIIWSNVRVLEVLVRK